MCGENFNSSWSTLTHYSDYNIRQGLYPLLPTNIKFPSISVDHTMADFPNPTLSIVAVEPTHEKIIQMQNKSHFQDAHQKLHKMVTTYFQWGYNYTLIFFYRVNVNNITTMHTKTHDIQECVVRSLETLMGGLSENHSQKWTRPTQSLLHQTRLWPAKSTPWFNICLT